MGETARKNNIEHGAYCHQGEALNGISEKIGEINGTVKEFKSSINRSFDKADKRFGNLETTMSDGFSEIKTILSEKIAKKDLKFGFFSSTKGKVVTITGAGGALTCIVMMVIEAIKKLS